MMLSRLAVPVLALSAMANTLAAAPPSPNPGIDIAGMDKSVAPGDDFFAHANGTWFKTTEIPPDKPSYGAGWVVFDLTTQRTAELIEKAEAGETVVITRHGKPVVRLVVDQEARRAKVRGIFDWMFAERAKHPGATVEEILAMRDEGRRF